MRCPQCGARETRVVDSRDLDDAATIRRRRECGLCSARFTTYERIEAARLVVMKRDGTRQEFDRNIRAELEAGRVRITPYDPADLQPSSVDLHLDRSFRVFRNNRYPYIDVRAPQPDLTELLRVENEEPFIHHPGEFVLGQTLEW